MVEIIFCLDRDLFGRVLSVFKNFFGRVVSFISFLGGESGKDVDFDFEFVEFGRSERRGSEEVGKFVYWYEYWLVKGWFFLFCLKREEIYWVCFLVNYFLFLVVICFIVLI